MKQNNTKQNQTKQNIRPKQKQNIRPKHTVVRFIFLFWLLSELSHKTGPLVKYYIILIMLMSTAFVFLMCGFLLFVVFFLCQYSMTHSHLQFSSLLFSFFVICIFKLQVHTFPFISPFLFFFLSCIFFFFLRYFPLYILDFPQCGFSNSNRLEQCFLLLWLPLPSFISHFNMLLVNLLQMKFLTYK